MLSERVVFSALLAAIAGYAVVDAFNFTAAARLLPLVFGIPTFVMSVIVLGMEIHGQRTGNIRRGTSSESLQSAGPATAEEQRRWRSREVSIIGWLVGLLLLVILVGFLWALPIFLILFLRIHGRQKWPVVIGVAGGVFLVFYLLFAWALQLPLYPGVLPLPVIE